MFKLFVITHPEKIDNESHVINALFNEGLECLHLRKPNAGIDTLEAYIKNIKPEFINRVVIHHHYSLIERYNLKGVHLTSMFYEALSREVLVENINLLHKHGMTVSASLHSMEELRNMKQDFDYIFISPIFDSISKPNHKSAWSKKEITEYMRCYASRSKIIGLGGINAENIHEVYSMGLHGAALLGSIWSKPKDAVKNYLAIHSEVIKLNHTKTSLIEKE
ncbi:MAG: thiamine phosphate synthase [Cytophagaceae bacterium]|nr:thiamine phosphate synthase [Cytophagaceae bacterium]MDW8456896.1 thiamine phosphate synthase [Cytophagaceae bacterium]